MRFKIYFAPNVFTLHEIQGGKETQRLSQYSKGNDSLYSQVRIVSRNDEYLVPPFLEINSSLVVEFLAFGKIIDNDNNEIIIGVKREVFESLIPFLKSLDPELQEETD